MSDVLDLWKSGLSAKAIARATRVDVPTIYAMAREAGLARTRRWTATEDKIVVALAPVTTCVRIAVDLPGRTPGAICARYWRLTHAG